MATRIILKLSAMALCATGFSGAAFAQSEAPASVSVPYSDLNLASADGQKTLAIRIKSAVRSVCGDANGRDLKANQLHQQCKAQAMRRAEIRSNNVIAQYRSDRRVASSDRVIVGN